MDAASIASVVRPAGLGLARQPHRRGRGDPPPAAARGRAIAPAGASRGSREAVDLRDGGSRLGGLGVSGAVANVRERIAPRLLGLDVRDQRALDAALIALRRHAAEGLARRQIPPWRCRSQGCTRRPPRRACRCGGTSASGSGRTPSLPLPEIQVFGGGAHAGRRVDIQDFMIMVPGARDLDEAFEVTAEVYRAAGAILARRGRLAGVADEGGWWPEFPSNEAALDHARGGDPGRRRGARRPGRRLARRGGVRDRAGRALPSGALTGVSSTETA